MPAYRSIVYREIVEIDGVEHKISTCDYTDSINEKIDCGIMSHLDSEVVGYVSLDNAKVF
ncbi:hypothetical protein UFOVP431_21 [uncultured Caudovirales phage]|uniref:Uncharacterized protein n=1 Tax=uncultured Caudovirales phage TaxID=2100421 RepID=A0A6J5MMQ3_9CAUD|nr:hypothetical protein UFOVP431_21 [uncultured Caudovirales phage]